MRTEYIIYPVTWEKMKYIIKRKGKIVNKPVLFKELRNK
jgi:hypothetical protein